MATESTLSFERGLLALELLHPDSKLGRLAWLAKLINPDDLYFFQDGELSQSLFNEILDAYIAGLDLAACVLGFTFIERSIAGRLSHIGESVAAKGRSEQLLAEALRRGWLSQEEHSTLDGLRLNRNPLVHFKDRLEESRPEIRAIMNAKNTKELLSAEARRIVEAVFTVLKKTSL
jgi:hypothetical protein